MNIEPHESSTEQFNLTEKLIDRLYENDVIEADARLFLFEKLHGKKDWISWLSRLSLILGATLVLSGIIYFFAFNWTRIPYLVKFGVIEAGFASSIIILMFYGIEHLYGKIMLLTASILIGVFLAVFGQVYQTGADAYNLFMFWAILICPFVLISNFAALWMVWLIISNIFLILFWNQVVKIKLGYTNDNLIFICLSLFNAFFLAMREYLVTKKVYWLKGRWIRIFLIIYILQYLMIPTTAFIFSSNNSSSTIAATVLSFFVHLAFYFIYQYKFPDILAMTLTFLSIGLIIELIMFKYLMNYLYSSLTYIFIGALTICLIVIVVKKLHVIMKKIETNHV